MSESTWTRRKFFSATSKALLTAGSFSALPKPAQAAIHEDNLGGVLMHGFSVLQGYTDASSTRLSVDIPRRLKMAYRLIDQSTGRIIEPSSVNKNKFHHSSWRVDHIHFTNLENEHTYYFQIKDYNGLILDERLLKTLDLNNPKARIAFLSCMLDLIPVKTIMWESLKKSNPDLILFTGDCVYSDLIKSMHGPKVLWRRFIETRRRIPFYHYYKLTPVIATWDDHDFGKNNAGGDYKHKVDSLKTFNIFFPQNFEDPNFKRGPGVSSKFSAFGQEFLLLDNRYYRKLETGGRKQFFGNEQLDWLQYHCNVAQGPIWLIQGSQWLNAYMPKGESFERDYQDEYSDIKKILRQANAPALLISGDVHYSETMDIESELFGYATKELTSSCMHSKPARPEKNNPRRKNATAMFSFSVVDIDSTLGSETSFQLKALSYLNSIRYKETFSL